jgi:hypothetical protein
MPHDGGTRAARRRLCGEMVDVRTPVLGKRASRIDLGPDRVAVMNKEKSQGSSLSLNPSSFLES